MTQVDKARLLDLAEEVLGHLGAAKMQLLPSDDARISDHIKAAHAHALDLFRGLK